MTRAAIICAAVVAGIWPAYALASPLVTVAPLTDVSADRPGGDIASTDAPLHRPAARAEPASAANPLWAIPLSTLTATRERPPFAPTRKPPPVVSDARPRPPERLPPRPQLPEAPPLKLIGTIVGAAKGFALFIDTSNKAVVRLGTGGSYHGWLLRTVRERSVVLEKNHLNQTLALPTPQYLQPVAIARPPEPTLATEDAYTRPQHRLRRAPIDATNAYR